jgi:c-di-GMP phosphodiesterase
MGHASNRSGDARTPARAFSVQVARQPLFDSALRVTAYELLYRSAGDDRANITDAIEATAQVIAGATLDIGLIRLAGKCPAFINFPAELIASSVQIPLAPDRIVIEVLEGAVPSQKLVDGLSRLRAEGYRIALDDFDIRTECLELLDYADIVKLDIQQHSSEALAQGVAELRRHRVQLVAEKIETGEELARCQELGFDLYQGYFLQRPETFSERRVPESRVAVMELVLSLDEDRAPAEKIEAAIERDVGLSYRLLRCINSSYYRRPREVGSIRQAILLLGYEELRKICAVILLTSLNDRPAYLAVQALTRAKMCEALSSSAGMKGCEGYFMTGLLSLADAFFGMPMQECLRQLPLNEPVHAALLLGSGQLGAALRCVRAHERGDWEQATFYNLSGQDITAAYGQAVEWAEGVLACAEHAA